MNKLWEWLLCIKHCFKHLLSFILNLKEQTLLSSSFNRLEDWDIETKVCFCLDNKLGVLPTCLVLSEFFFIWTLLLNAHNQQWSWCCYHPHFTDQETEAWRGWITCPGHTLVRGRARIKSRQADSGNPYPAPHVCNLDTVHLQSDPLSWEVGSAQLVPATEWEKLWGHRAEKRSRRVKTHAPSPEEMWHPWDKVRGFSPIRVETKLKVI